MKDKPKWLTKAQVIILHAETLRLFGGARGIRDEGLLASALAKPRKVGVYDDAATIYELATSYAYWLCRYRPFIDGTVRASLLVVRAFLFQNQIVFTPDPIEMVTVFEGLATGRITESQLTRWIQANSKWRPRARSYVVRVLDRSSQISKREHTIEHPSRSTP